MILGIDEVGRGPWAGPLVVGAVVLSEGVSIEGLNDSKKLSAKRRAELDTLIRQNALGWGLGWVHAQELDEVGLSMALKLATIRAVEAVRAPYHEIVIDGTINFLKETSKGDYVTTMAKADALVPAVSAASIIAKVARDTYMEEQDQIYPEYGFASHVGYGTAKHRDALLKHGVTVLHRTSFAPIKKLHNQGEPPQVKAPSSTVGSVAEDKVAQWLQSKSFIILDRNWKTKFCEIDIVARQNNTVYFIEVKYRSTEKQGGGIAAITPRKLQQMRFAAEFYIARNNTTANVKLAVVSLSPSSDVTLLEIE